ncbi:ATP-binding protein [Streptomyces sp. NBC_01257]|uniref:ATP-binding protein n=1 Tax=Streptomyces sp. NBC_01257 TaxID=2903799 RepID=UPI002DD8EA5C|nr:ATP-binding protein [Streptomyces sp. NBC_01257]WRZ67351.1 ATP-binding protein [Streptomyces sp. NBC_01257]
MTAQQAQQAVTVSVFTHRLPATRRGANLARRLAVGQLGDWGIGPAAPLCDTVALIVAELAANAVLHGRVPGRDFELRLTYEHESAHVCVEVSDTHPGRPEPSTSRAGDAFADGGRGLHLVAALAHRWGVSERNGPGKTVWAQTGPMRERR